MCSRWLSALRAATRKLATAQSNPVDVRRLRGWLNQADVGRGLWALVPPECLERVQQANQPLHPGDKDAVREAADTLLTLTSAAVDAQASPTGPFIHSTLLPALARYHAVLTEARAASVLRRLFDLGLLREALPDSPNGAVVKQLVRSSSRFTSAKSINHVIGVLTESPGWEREAIAYISAPKATWPREQQAVEQAATGSVKGLPAFDAVRVLRCIARLSTFQRVERTAAVEEEDDVRMMPFSREVVQYLVEVLPYLRGSHKVVLIRSCEQLLNADSVTQGAPLSETSSSLPASRAWSSEASPLPMTAKDALDDVKLLLKDALRSFAAPLQNAPATSLDYKVLDTSLSHVCRVLACLPRCERFVKHGEADTLFDSLAVLVADGLERDLDGLTFIGVNDLITAIQQTQRSAAREVLARVVAAKLDQILATTPAGDVKALTHMLVGLTPLVPSVRPSDVSRVMTILSRKCAPGVAIKGDLGFAVAAVGFHVPLQHVLPAEDQQRALPMELRQVVIQTLTTLAARATTDQTTASAAQQTVKQLLRLLRLMVKGLQSRDDTVISLIALRLREALTLLQNNDTDGQLSHYAVQAIELTNMARAGLLTSAVLGVDKEQLIKGASSREHRLSLSETIIPVHDEVMMLTKRCIEWAAADGPRLARTAAVDLAAALTHISTALLLQCFAGLRNESQLFVEQLLLPAARRVLLASGDGAEAAGAHDAGLKALRIAYLWAMCCVEHGGFMVASVARDVEVGSIASAIGVPPDAFAAFPKLLTSVDAQAQLAEAFRLCLVQVKGVDMHRQITAALPFVIKSSNGVACGRIATVTLVALLGQASSAPSP